MKRTIIIIIMTLIIIATIPPTTATTPIKVYDWQRDEPETDGYAENLLGIIGDLSDNRTINSTWLINSQKTHLVDQIRARVISVVGNPNSDSFVYDIFIGETTATNLTANTTLGADITGNHILVKDNVTIINPGVGNDLIINFDTEYQLRAGRRYAICFIHVSSNSQDSTNDIISLGADANTTKTQYRRVFDDTTAQTFSFVGAINLTASPNINEGIIQTINNYIPLVIALCFIGIALSAIGINIGKRCRP